MSRRFGLFTSSLVFIAATSCRSSEEEVIDRFLEASRREDNETVAALSMVAFPEEVLDWEVLHVAEARREPYRIPTLKERLAEAEHRRDAQFREFGEFRQENYDELARIQRLLRDDPDAALTGRQVDLSRLWDAFREERREVVSRLHEAEQELEWELRRVQKSLQREADPEYLSGETLRRDARVLVETPSGERVYRVTLSRYDVRNSFDAVVPTRWVVAEVEPETS